MRSTEWPSSAGDALRRTGSYRLAGDEEEREGIRLEYEALREDGFEAEWLDDVPGGAAGRFHGAISHPHDGSIQPARFVRRLAALRDGGGSGVPRARPGRGRRRARRRPRSRRDRRLRPRPRPGARRPRLADPRPGDRERAARPRALRPPALRAPGLRLLAAAPRRPDPARRLSRRLDPRRAHGRRGDDADDPVVPRVVPPRARGRARCR